MGSRAIQTDIDQAMQGQNKTDDVCDLLQVLYERGYRERVRMERVMMSIMLGSFCVAVITAVIWFLWPFVISIAISGGCGLYLCFHLEGQLEKDKNHDCH